MVRLSAWPYAGTAVVPGGAVFFRRAKTAVAVTPPDGSGEQGRRRAANV